MTRAQEYRHLAEMVLAKARQEENPNLSAEWERLAETYEWRNKLSQTRHSIILRIRYSASWLEHAIKRLFISRVPGTLKLGNKQKRTPFTCVGICKEKGG